MTDITLHITDRDGNNHTVEAPTDMNLNLMEVIRMYELAPEGTIGVCGGMALCASCQCYIESAIELPPQTDDEEAMLAEASYVKENSRLSCQLYIEPALNNLKLTLAPES